MLGIYSSLTGPGSISEVRGSTSKIGEDFLLVKEKQAVGKEKEEKEIGEGWDGIIRRVVIGVPANCSEMKKEATRRAARCAGFEEVLVQCTHVH